MTGTIELRFDIEGNVHPLFELRKGVNIGVRSGGRQDEVQQVYWLPDIKMF